jgi:hypothetical protein
MLRQIICVVCEKVIVSADNDISLINLFDKMLVSMPLGTEIPNNAAVPKEWALFVKWETGPGDELTQYTFCWQMVYPDESLFGETTRLKLQVEPPKRAQVNVRVNAFPIGQEGTFKVRTWLEDNKKSVLGLTDTKIEVEWQSTPTPEPPKATSPSTLR